MAGLKVMSARALEHPMQALARAFTAERGTPVELVFGTVGMLQERLAKGETADVLVLSGPLIAKLETAGTVATGTRADLAVTSIGLAVRVGASAPDFSTPEAFRAMIVAARSVAFSDPAVGGSATIHLAALFERMGLTDTVMKKAVLQRNGAEVGRRVADGTAEIGMTQTAELAPIPGITIVGALPPPMGNDTVYTAGVAVASDQLVEARRLVAALSVTAAAPHWEAAGFTLPM
jgi:molybdate transport system substrate-binding protein